MKRSVLLQYFVVIIARTMIKKMSLKRYFVIRREFFSD